MQRPNCSDIRSNVKPVKAVCCGAKCTASPVLAWTGPEGSKSLKHHISQQSAHEGSKFVSPTYRPPLPPRKYSWYPFLMLGSSAGIATDYVLDGPESYPGGDEIFRPSRPALGPTQPPVKWVPCLSLG